MAFNLLAIEINEHISSYLPTDWDVCNFRLACKTTNAAVSSHRCGVWRALFARRYDMLPGKAGLELKMLYQIRARFLYKLTPIFHMGQESKEIRCMEHLRNLVVESYADKSIGGKAKEPSKNIRELRRFMLRTNFLDKILSRFYDGPNINPLLHTLQLVFTHWHLDHLLRNPTYGFSHSQHVVYAHPTNSPMFLDRNRFRVNIDFFLHTANFFKYHMTSEGEQTLYPLMRQLEEDQKPRAWEGPIKQARGVPLVKKLGSHWKGSYAYLDPEDMPHIREMPYTDHCLFTDNIDFQDGFQTLDLDFSRSASIAPWPRAFDSHLDALPSNPLCRTLHSLSKHKKRHIQGANRTHHPLVDATLDTGLGTPPSSPGHIVQQTLTMPHRILPTSAEDMPPSPNSPPPVLTPKKGVNYLQFAGSGNDAERFQCSGIVHPLPPQHGIPGWQRVTIMKFFDPISSSSAGGMGGSTTPLASDDGFELDDGVNINNGCWAYEGVVLPGGMIMLGRWWSPMDDMEERHCMGPFIFWNVAGEEGQ